MQLIFNVKIIIFLAYYMFGKISFKSNLVCIPWSWSKMTMPRSNGLKCEGRHMIRPPVDLNPTQCGVPQGQIMTFFRIILLSDYIVSKTICNVIIERLVNQPQSSCINKRFGFNSSVYQQSISKCKIPYPISCS